MAKQPKIDWKPGQRIARDAQGNIIATRTAAQAGSGGGSATAGGKASPLAQFAAVVKGFAKPGSVSKDAQKALAKLDVGSIGFKELAKFGLDENLTKEQFREFKGLLKAAQKEGPGKKVGKKEIKELAKFGQGTALDNTVADLDRGVDKIIPDVEDSVIQTPVGQAGTVSPQRGQLANLDMSIFARRAVSRAQGIRSAIKTSMRGDAGYGRSLARISLGAV